jgi:tyrosine-protein phosphatase YwqE
MILLDKVNNVSIKDMNEIARLWDDTLDVSASMSEMEDAIADFVASDYSIYRAYHVIEDTQSALSKKIKDAEQIIKEKKELLKNKIIKQSEFDKIKKEKQLIIDTAKKERD